MNMADSQEKMLNTNLNIREVCIIYSRINPIQPVGLYLNEIHGDYNFKYKGRMENTDDR